ncbi:hypothetical protein OYC64_011929 [Pagothenia borchgrevinki]|uniref:Uncharacterized protein n=1 Tax=Pagothenia borchgrevinki TaxID=8213 RepID=A0ABD2FGY7_PAGBO
MTEESPEKQLRLRVCVLSELLHTERDYVQTLEFLSLKVVFCHRRTESGAASPTEGSVGLHSANILATDLQRAVSVSSHRCVRQG